MPEARAAVSRLLETLGDVEIPETLISQYLPRIYDTLTSRGISAEPRTLLIEAVRHVLRMYGRATAVV